MRPKRILIPAVTVADWGGLHEWVAEASGWLVEAGHTVTVAGRGERFIAAVQQAGAEVIPVADWKQWVNDLHHVVNYARDSKIDIIFTHGPQARALGIAVGSRLDLPVYVMVHGAYHDYAFEWVEKAHRFITASPSLADYMAGVAKIPRELIRVVPNGVPRDVESLPILPLSDKLSDGIGRIVTASRLDLDKLPQVAVINEVVASCQEALPDVHWRVDVYGDGMLRRRFEDLISSHLASLPNCSAVFHGWTRPENIPLRMNEAVVGVVAGLGGMRSIATGTACVAVGARNTVGVQVGENLRKGIYSNFGDHGTQSYAPTPIRDDLQRLLKEPGAYDTAVREAREFALAQRSAGHVRRSLFASLDLPDSTTPVPAPAV